MLKNVRVIMFMLHGPRAQRSDPSPQSEQHSSGVLQGASLAATVVSSSSNAVAAAMAAEEGRERCIGGRKLACRGVNPLVSAAEPAPCCCWSTGDRWAAKRQVAASTWSSRKCCTSCSHTTDNIAKAMSTTPNYEECRLAEIPILRTADWLKRVILGVRLQRALAAKYLPKGGTQSIAACRRASDSRAARAGATSSGRAWSSAAYVDVSAACSGASCVSRRHQIAHCRRVPLLAPRSPRAEGHRVLWPVRQAGRGLHRVPAPQEGGASL
jgi:hypothetical protein